MAAPLISICTSPLSPLPTAESTCRARPPTPSPTITFDGVTTGAYTDVAADMTLLLGSSAGADDYGRVRVQNVATSTTIPIPRTSAGIEDGQLTIVDNAYITVLDRFPCVGQSALYCR